MTINSENTISTAKSNPQTQEEDLHSFWLPGLQAGTTHRVSVRQIVDPQNGETPLELTGDQTFTVEAPQFSLPEGSIHSVYPPPGYSEEQRILPHVVLNDAHLPWERKASNKPLEQEGPNRVPWLALVSFTHDELIYQNDGYKQTSTMSVKMSLDDLLSKDVATPVRHVQRAAETAQHTPYGFIFVKPQLFMGLFTDSHSHDQEGSPVRPDITPYKFLSHVRKINTGGMAVSGKQDDCAFSVVIGIRSGPLNIDAPTSVAVHLISLEGIEDMPLGDKSHVALCSLHSWNYTVVPKGMPNASDTIQSISQNIGFLRPPEAVLDHLRRDEYLHFQLVARLEDAYSMVKYRVQTGETTVALFRGPFTPRPVDYPALLADCSNSGVDLQILDREIGIMDISYSCAWNLGRTLALGDQVFAGALNRLRLAIHKLAMKNAQRAIVLGKSKHGHRTQEDVVKSLPALTDHLSELQLTKDESSFKPGGPLKRWHRPRLDDNEIPSFGYMSQDVAQFYDALAAVKELTASAEGNEPHVDETKTPVHSDLMIVQSWVMDRMSLAGVPAHYLITDPSHLEHESLRLFYIDPKWINSMIDGALSLANHWIGEDKDRIAIKSIINEHIMSTSDEPRIPASGFLLRSDIVSAFPDLRITPSNHASLTRHEILADGVMLGLLDQIPGSEALTHLSFRQPPHQQKYAVGQELDGTHVQVNIRHQYTQDAERSQNLLSQTIHKMRGESDSPFTWVSQPGNVDLHILRLPYFAEMQKGALVNGTGSSEVSAATSALFACQLSEPHYALTVDLGSLGTIRASPELSQVGQLGSQNSSPMSGSSFPRDEQPVSETAGTPGSLNNTNNLAPVAPEQGQNASVETVKVQRHESYIPAPHVTSANQAPHTRTIPLLQDWPKVPSIPPSPSAMLRTQGSPSPRFQCKIYTPGFPKVVTRRGYEDLPQDLIISVVPDEGVKESLYELVAFDVTIHLADTDSDSTCLLKDYDGPGAHMLNNLRLNVVTCMSRIYTGRTRRTILHMRLLPRTKCIPVRSIREMGFMLPMAKVNCPTCVGRRSVYTQVWYTTRSDDGPFGQFEVDVDIVD